jgi:hypothetical protein
MRVAEKTITTAHPHADAMRVAEERGHYYSINQFVRDLHVPPLDKVDVYFMKEMTTTGGTTRTYIKPLLVLVFDYCAELTGRIIYRAELDKMLQTASPVYGDVYYQEAPRKRRTLASGLNLLRAYTDCNSKITHTVFIEQMPRPILAKRLIEKYGKSCLVENRSDDYHLKTASKKILTSWATKTIQKFARAALAR